MRYTTWLLIGVSVFVGLFLILLGILFFTGLLVVSRVVTAPYYGYPFFYPFGLFFGFIFLFLIFGVLRWVLWPRPWGWGYGHRYSRYNDRAYYILRERYARGEITKDQYDQMVRDLQERRV